jgi:hypothetical protein
MLLGGLSGCVLLVRGRWKKKVRYRRRALALALRVNSSSLSLERRELRHLLRFAGTLDSPVRMAADLPCIGSLFTLAHILAFDVCF